MSEQLRGAWWSTGAAYHEVIFTDSLVWTYSELAGALAFKYTVEDSTIVKRTWPWGGRAASSKVVSAGADSIVLMQWRDRVVLRPLQPGFNNEFVSKLINADSAALAAYIASFRSRARAQRK